MIKTEQRPYSNYELGNMKKDIVEMIVKYLEPNAYKKDDYVWRDLDFGLKKFTLAQLQALYLLMTHRGEVK